MSAETASERRVALLRGVNVGGKKVLMAPLRDLAGRLGATDVKTYIASGNLVFSARGSDDALAKALRQAIATTMGVDTPVMVLSATALSRVLKAHPWAPDAGRQSHIFFCWGAPTIDDALYQEWKAPDEALRIIDGHVHFYAPGGLGQSRLADRLGKVIPETTMTGRNLNTVRTLVDMAGG